MTHDHFTNVLATSWPEKRMIQFHLDADTCCNHLSSVSSSSLVSNTILAILSIHFHWSRRIIASREKSVPADPLLLVGRVGAPISRVSVESIAYSKLPAFLRNDPNLDENKSALHATLFSFPTQRKACFKYQVLKLNNTNKYAQL